ncbi:MAG: amidohydrolase family protein, partial [Candidatus Eremiobacteraeota bacterium]|nr:amidohydrolase family protein [Candidatus Eremiobacteraeota bacterium]
MKTVPRSKYPLGRSLNELTPQECDFLISTVLSQATIFDGTGKAPYITDIGIVDGKIALIGDLQERDAVERIPCAGQSVAPGFIDVHSHSDELWLALPRCDGKIAQGVTTEIGGNCGMSVAPLSGPALERVRRSAKHLDVAVDWRSLDEFFTAVERQGTALNVATLVGLGTTRQHVAGDSERKLEASELLEQARIVREACEQGALGVSSGLIYPPSQYADIDELTAMSVAAREAGAPIYASHVRDEADGLLEAIEEALEIGLRAGVTVQCSHHKAQDKRNWGKVHRSLQLIDSARRRGCNAFADVYPYTASWTDLATILPDDARYGGPEATLERLSDARAAGAIAFFLGMKPASDWGDILITEVGSHANAGLAGMRLDAIAQSWNVSPPVAAIRLLREEHLEVGAVFFRMCEDDVATVLSYEYSCIGSDASARALRGPTARGVPHPRTFGTFPRIFGRYVRQRKTLEIAEAVRRMTSLPADIFGLRDRGRIVTGACADIVVFDAASIRDEATYERPFAFP